MDGLNPAHKMVMTWGWLMALGLPHYISHIYLYAGLLQAVVPPPDPRHLGLVQGSEGICTSTENQTGQAAGPPTGRMGDDWGAVLSKD